MARVLIHALDENIDSTVHAHGASRTTCRANADIIVTAGPVDAPAGATVLQFGGPVPELRPRPRLVDVPRDQTFLVTPDAYLMGLAPLLKFNLLLDAPTTGMWWEHQGELGEIVPLASTPTGHTAAFRARRPTRGMLWWVHDNALDPEPWVSHVLAATLHGTDLE